MSSIRTEDFLSSLDDDIIFNETEIQEPQFLDKLFGAAEEHPINNIFMFHPHFNTHNIAYQEGLERYLSLFGDEPIIGEPQTIEIPSKKVKVPIRNPENWSEWIEIEPFADTGSAIECINTKMAERFKALNRLKFDKDGKEVLTGNGRTTVHHYVPITLKSANGKQYHYKFWHLPSLPSEYEWLIGHELLYKLGWELTNRYEKYVHRPRTIDDIESELEDLACSNYPLFDNEPELDLSKVKVADDRLRPFIHEQLKNHRENIAKHEWDSGRILKEEFPINFIDGEHPLKKGFMSKEYGMNPKSRKEVRRQIHGMLQHDVIEPCLDPQFVSALFATLKKTGDVRIVFDYRKLNLITERMQFPIPRMDDLLSRFKGKNFITSLDMKGGYWHIPLKKEHRRRTAFIFDGKIYQWKVLPFGPTNAPMYFQQCMQSIFGDLDFVIIYLDDISILSDTIEEHKEHLRIVFDRLKQHCIKLRIDKCLWGVEETEYLGFIVNKSGIKTKEKYVQKILDVPEPKSQKALLRYIGLCQYLHRFIPQMHFPLSILTKLTAKSKTRRIKMTDEERKAFNDLKAMVRKTDYLLHPDLQKEFHVFTDASKYGIGGMLAQINDDGVMQPVSYCSKVFNPTQTRWHVSEQEIYAAIYCIEKWSSLLRYRKFTLHTDHRNLQDLFNKASDWKSGKLFRWAVRLQDYHFECQYIKGIDNDVADFLSRDSVMLQAPQYAKVKEFYDANPLFLVQFLSRDSAVIQETDESVRKRFYNAKDPNQDPIRKMMAMNGGVDIKQLYIQHLVGGIRWNEMLLLRSNPFESLLLSDGLRYSDQIPAILPLTNHNDDISSADSESDDGDLEAMSSPRPYVQPTDPEPDPEPTRHSRYLPRAAKEKNVKPKPSSQQFKPLRIRKHRRWKLPRDHRARQKYRDIQRIQNEQILEAKPSLQRFHIPWFQHSYDARKRSGYRYELDRVSPIKDYYDEDWTTDTHRLRNLIRWKQNEDPFCAAVDQFLAGNKELTGTLPEWHHRFILSGRFIKGEDSIIRYLHGKLEKRMEDIPLIFAPASLRKSILRKAHSRCHHGKKQMLRIIQDEFEMWWPKMEVDAGAYAFGCNTCQHMKSGSFRKYKRTGKMKTFSATQPFEQISVDIVGPLPISYSENRYIVTMIDCFSRYCMLVPVTDITALSVIKAIDRWITTFGSPKSILSDNGPQFISAAYRHFMKHHKIDMKYSSTYHPQTNGQIERLHRWIKERLRLIAYDGSLDFISGQDDWSEYLPFIQYTYNTTPNRMTSYAPMTLVTGNDVRKMEDAEFDGDCPRSYLEYLRARQEILRNKALHQQQKYDDIRLRTFNKDRREDDYEVGQKILWNVNAQHNAITGNQQKFGPRWLGPYEIMEIKHEGQSFRIKAIPQCGNNKDNFLNTATNPRTGSKKNFEDKVGRPWMESDGFTVPRSQIKPYFKSYEEMHDGEESPTNVAINFLRSKLTNPPSQQFTIQSLEPWMFTELKYPFHADLLDLEFTPWTDRDQPIRHSLRNVASTQQSQQYQNLFYLYRSLDPKVTHSITSRR